MCIMQFPDPKRLADEAFPNFYIKCALLCIFTSQNASPTLVCIITKMLHCVSTVALGASENNDCDLVNFFTSSIQENL